MTRTILNDIYTNDDSLLSDPLENGGKFKALADDLFLLLRVITVETYALDLREKTVQAKTRIKVIEEEIAATRIKNINEKSDIELDEMNDLLNMKVGE